MTRTTASQKHQANARQRRRRNAHARLPHDHAQAPRAVQALAQALQELELPQTLVQASEERLRSQPKRLGNICGRMFPPRLRCRTPAEVSRGRGWDQHLPPRLLGALPQRSWRKRRRRVGRDVLVPRWRHRPDKSPATESRGPGTWVADAAVFKTYGQPWGLVGTWGSGPEKRVRPGMDGVWVSVGMGDGTRVVPVDVAIRRPDPRGPGAPCRDTRIWVQVRLDAGLASLGRRGLQLPSPWVVAASWVSDSQVRRSVSRAHQGTLGVEGKHAAGFTVPDGRQVTGGDVVTRGDWPWRHHPWEPRVRSARLSATRPTYGLGTWVIGDEPGQDRLSLLCLATALHAPRLRRLWRRRRGSAYGVRTLQPLWATEACQVQREDASDGHVVLRLRGCFIVCYTTRLIGTGELTRQERVVSLTHDWRVVDSDALA